MELKNCVTCKFEGVELDVEPCRSCIKEGGKGLFLVKVMNPKEAFEAMVATSLRSALSVLLETTDRLSDITYEEHEAIQKLLDQIKDLFQEVSWGRLEV